MLTKIEDNIYFCLCDVCGTELHRNKRSALKRNKHYCNAKCVMQAVREGNILRVTNQIELEIACLDLRRNKICNWCKLKYIDVTKRNVGKTCSKKCSNELSVATRKINGSYVRTEIQNAKLSITLKDGYATGRLVSHVTQETLQKAHNANRGPKPNHWSKTPEAREAMSLSRRGLKPSDATRTKMSIAAQNRIRNKRDTLYTSACGGYREDLRQYFRSRWEANFARILNYQGKSWKYESTTFQLDNVTSYTPDFLCEGIYYEIKGRWYKGHIEKVAKFKEKYPDLPFVLIEEQEYNKLSKQYKMLVSGWEGK